MENHLKEYLAIMGQDASMQYQDEHGKEPPDAFDVDERAMEDAKAVIKAFYEKFPDSKTDGGEVYLERVYGDEVAMPKEEREWIRKNCLTDATAVIGESVDGDIRLFFE